eukprot:scaffold5517_cov135-Cylindrotheca_fusiformis.AAC.1
MGATKAATANTAMTEEGERTERQEAPTRKKGGPNQAGKATKEQHRGELDQAREKKRTSWKQC